MPRIATDRDTHLTAAEIAAEALRQFDTLKTDPSIRGLAAELRVAPTAIYHHFSSGAAIYQAAVDLVWEEATQRFFEAVPDPFEADPTEVFVAMGISTRRAWLAHHRLARFMTATPEANDFITNVLALMANLFERLGLEGDDAAVALHTYSSFVLGAILFAASRTTANEQLDVKSRKPEPRERFHFEPNADEARRSSERTRLSIDEMMDLSIVDPERDEELFVLGVRRLIESFVADAG